jgi:hypothetical protein
MSTRGLTLVELLLALVMGAAVLSAIGAVTTWLGREVTRRRIALDQERSHTAIWGVLTEHFRGATAGETQVVAPTAVDFRRPIGEGIVCAANGATLGIGRSGWLGERLPDPARDRAVVHDGTAWSLRGIVSVSVANCPAGESGIRLTLSSPVAGAVLLRVDEHMRLRHYQAGGAGWLGLESLGGGGVIQPLAGPLAAGDFVLGPLPSLVTATLWATSQAFPASVVIPLEAP